MAPLSAPMIRALMLDLKVRFRAIGVWPWLVLVLWGILARVGEPADVFRPFGILLSLHGIWFGAIILLCALLLAGQPPLTGSCIRRSVYMAIGLVGLVGVVQSMFAFLLDLVFPARIEPAVYLESLWTFVVVWLPTAVAWCSQERSARPADRALPWVALAVSVLLAIPAWRVAPWRSIAASALAVSGVVVFRVSASIRSSYQAGSRPMGIQP
jgi:hypothetical protein